MDTNDYIKLYNLKVDPKLPHHYIIGIATKPIISKTPGKIFLKYGPIHYTNDDVVNMAEAKQLISDKLFKTTPSEALYGRDVGILSASLGALFMTARMTEATVHHFSSEYPIEDEWFVDFIETAHMEHTKQLLESSRIRA